MNGEALQRYLFVMKRVRWRSFGSAGLYPTSERPSRCTPPRLAAKAPARAVWA